MRLELVVNDYRIALTRNSREIQIRVAHYEGYVLLLETISYEYAPELRALTDGPAWNLNEVIALIDEIEIELADEYEVSDDFRDIETTYTGDGFTEEYEDR